MMLGVRVGKGAPLVPVEEPVPARLPSRELNLLVVVSGDSVDVKSAPVPVGSPVGSPVIPWLLNNPRSLEFFDSVGLADGCGRPDGWWLEMMVVKPTMIGPVSEELFASVGLAECVLRPVGVGSVIGKPPVDPRKVVLDSRDDSAVGRRPVEFSVDADASSGFVVLSLLLDVREVGSTVGRDSPPVEISVDFVASVDLLESVWWAPVGLTSVEGLPPSDPLNRLVVEVETVVGRTMLVGSPLLVPSILGKPNSVSDDVVLADEGLDSAEDELVDCVSLTEYDLELICGCSVYVVVRDCSDGV